MQLSAALVIALTGPLAAPFDDPAPRGTVSWFEGTHAEAVQAAAERETLLVVEFWANWCGWCARHEAENLSDPQVVAALEPLVCFGADCSTDEEGNFIDPEAERLMRRYGVRRFPALVFFRPDGRPEGLVSGYLPAPKLRAEIARIRRGENTISDYEGRVERKPDDLEARYQLAIKLDAVGDVAGYQREIETIVRADPDGVSLPRRRMAFGLMREKLWGCMRDPEIQPDPAELEVFLAGETNPGLLCNAWLLMGAVQNELGSKARSREAYREAWLHVPESEVAPVGNGIAWGFWVERDGLTKEEKRFALQLAQRATERIEEESHDPIEQAMYFDTLACCYYMNGKRAKALELAKRCMELAPDDPAYRDRYELFKKRG